MWSYGAVMYEIWCLGHKPFEEFSNLQVGQAWTITFTMTTWAFLIWSAGPSTTGNEAGGPWVPSPPSPRLSQGSIWTHDSVLVSFYHIPVGYKKGGVWEYHINVCCIFTRNADRPSRPDFAELVRVLSSPVTDLLSWSEEDMRVHPQAAVLGAPLEAGKDLYPELQRTYMHN